jgi:hypothetical protein
MSPAAIRAVFSPDSDDDLLVLLTVYDPENPNQVVLRISDGYTGRIEALETPDEVIYGVRSRNQDFIFVPMEVSLPSEEEAQAPRCSLVLNDVTRYAIPIIREVSGPPKILMEIVLSSTPDVVEASFAGFYINSFTYNADSVTAELAMIDYEREPFPQHSFSPVYFPGMF